MTVQVKCSNIVSFDAASGKYVYCNQKIVVPQEKVGTTVRCPKCGGMVEVVPPAPQKLAVEERAGPAKDLFHDLPAPPSDTVVPPRPALAGPPVAATHTIRMEVKCINCHAALPRDTDICPACGYKQPAPDVAEEERGFQGWFGGHLSEGASFRAILILAGLLLVVMTLCCIGQYGGGIVSLVYVAAFVLVAMVGGVLGLVVVANRRPNEAWGAAARRLVHPWSLLLLWLRAWGWRQLSFPFASRKTLDRRDAAFTDTDLLAAEGLKEIQAMDLEGTQLTDQGLDYLREMPNLQFLVVRRTKVTEAGIRRLQDTRPALWIWQ